MVEQRPPQLGDWTVCQDKDTTKTAVRTPAIDSINQLNVLDWAIADYNNGKEQPYLYVPNRVYALDTVILKPTLEGLMPIPENLDGNCEFETQSAITISPSAQSQKYSCSVYCTHWWTCPYASLGTALDSQKCPAGKQDGLVLPLGVEVTGSEGVIIFKVRADSAFEYLDIKITDFPRHYTNVDGESIQEYNRIGWPELFGEDFTYTALGNNIFRIWAWPGGGRSGKWGPAGSSAKIKIVFSLLGGFNRKTIFYPEFSGAQRQVTVSYVGAGRRGNHRA